MSLLLFLGLFIGCSSTKSRTTYSRDPEEISKRRNNEIREFRDFCVLLIDSLEAVETEKNVDYALFMNTADSFSNKIKFFLEPLYQPSNQGDPDEFPQTYVERMYDSLRVFENFTIQTLCPTKDSLVYFKRHSNEVREMTGSNSHAVRTLCLIEMQRFVYIMLANNLTCRLK